MQKDIAVFVGLNGHSTTLEGPGRVIVYGKQQGSWQALREKDFVLEKSLGLAGLRRTMAEIVTFLGECRVFVAQAATGIPYYELEKAGCSVWEYPGEPLSFLDFIVDREKEEALEKAGANKPSVPEPEETGPGCFRLSLLEVQRNSSGITSKQALLPFLRRGAFYQLELVCDHVPPWLEAELAMGTIAAETVPASPGVKKMIITKTCNTTKPVGGGGGCGGSCG